MRGFRRALGRYVATFDAVEVRILADLVDQVRSLFAERRAVSDDPLAVLTGIAAAPATPPEDDVLARLLPDFTPDDAVLAGGLRQLHEPAIIAAKDAAATTLLDTLPPGGGAVHLDEEQAQAWIAALNDVRLAFGVRLGLDRDDVRPGPTGDPDADRVQEATLAAYDWLTAVQDSLVQQMLR